MWLVGEGVGVLGQGVHENSVLPLSFAVNIKSQVYYFKKERAGVRAQRQLLSANYLALPRTLHHNHFRTQLTVKI